MAVMKAEPSQFPVEKSRTDGLTKGRETSSNTLWAYVRRLQARVESLETGATTARRDINRIDKKQYRDIAKEPPSFIAPPEGDRQTQFDAALFG